MNKNQKAALLVGAAVIVLMGLFPPWDMDVYDTGTELTYRRLGLRSLYDGDKEVWYRFALLEPQGVIRDSTVIKMFNADLEIVPSEHWIRVPTTKTFRGEINVGRLMAQALAAAGLISGITVVLGKKPKTPA